MSAEATIWLAAFSPILIVSGVAFLAIHITAVRERKRV